MLEGFELAMIDTGEATLRVNPETIHTMCEDYRAGATYDFQLDEADRGTRRIACPVLALWAARVSSRSGTIWRDWADDVRGRSLDCGHDLPEEAPDETSAELRAFFAS